MTPTATRLKDRLDARRRWFANEWFFKWHFIGSDGPSVTIDSFDGRAIHLSGIKFSGTARDTYWEAVVRGVRKEITDQFAWVDEQVRNYNPETAQAAIDECAGLLTAFANSIRREALRKDRVLRGDGVRIPPESDAGRWDGTSSDEVRTLATELKESLPVGLKSAQSGDPVNTIRWRDRALDSWNRNQWWLGPVGLVGTILGIAQLVGW